MVKALKGDPVNGYFELSVDGIAHRFDKSNVGQFLDLVPRAMAAAILPRFEGNATLVPIPNSHVLRPDEPNFPTLKLATGMAAASGGRLTAAVALVFKEHHKKRLARAVLAAPLICKRPIRSSGTLRAR